MIVECPEEDCDFSNWYGNKTKARTGIKVHIAMTHPENRIELNKKAEDILCR